MKTSKLLKYPIGTVLFLKDFYKPVMIIGFFSTKLEDENIYDYVACVYPEGLNELSTLFYFNEEDIKMVAYSGYISEEEKNFKIDLKVIMEDDEDNENKDENEKIEVLEMSILKSE